MQGQLSTKALELVQEQMNQLSLACKKCTVYSGYFGDQKLKTLCDDIAQHHRTQFDALNQYLSSH